MIITQQRTITTIFIVPLLGINRETLNDVNYGFVDGYLLNAESEEVFDEEVIYLLFKPKDLIAFQMFVQAEKERVNTGLIDVQDYDGGYIVLVYKMPESMKAEFSKLLNGKYSEFSDALKNLYPKAIKIKDPTTHLHRDEIALQWRIFKKDKNLVKYWEDFLYSPNDHRKNTLKDIEVWSIPDVDRETLNFTQITESPKI